MTASYRTTPLPPVTDHRRWKVSCGEFCYLCGKPMRAKTVFQIHVVDGGGFLLHPQDEEIYAQSGGQVLAGDLGGWQIGPECSRKLPKEYRVKYQHPEKDHGPA